MDHAKGILRILDGEDLVIEGGVDLVDQAKALLIGLQKPVSVLSSAAEPQLAKFEHLQDLWLEEAWQDFFYKITETCLILALCENRVDKDCPGNARKL